jgi:hypothetical protein
MIKTAVHCFFLIVVLFSLSVRGSDGIWMVNGPPQLGSRPNFPG